jgi:hypothetical protein
VRRQHYCTITQTEIKDFDQCVVRVQFVNAFRMVGSNLSFVMKFCTRIDQIRSRDHLVSGHCSFFTVCGTLNGSMDSTLHDSVQINVV